MVENTKKFNMQAINYIVISAAAVYTITGTPYASADTDVIGQLAFEPNIAGTNSMMYVERYAGPVAPNVIEPRIIEPKIVRYAGPSMPNVVEPNINIVRYAGPTTPQQINSSPDIVRPETMMLRYAGPQMPEIQANPNKSMGVGNTGNFGAIEIGSGHFIFK